jgi:sRNA-binding protein
MSEIRRRLTMADLTARRAPVNVAITPAGPAQVKKRKPGYWARLRNKIGSDEVNWVTITLIKRWPDVFSTPPRPLAIGIHHAIRAATNNPPQTIALALHDWTTRTSYRAALVAGGPRYDLDGMAVGEVSAEQRATAAVLLAKRNGARRRRPSPASAHVA